MDIIHEQEKTVRVRKRCDVLVAGGGVAGIAAALAAARGGAEVILVEKQCALGGLATLGQITIYLPLCDGMGRQIIYGIGEELLKLSIRNGSEAMHPAAWLEGGSIRERVQARYQVQYNPWMFALLAEELLLSEGVEILYDTHITGVHMNDVHIAGVVADNKEGHWATAVHTVVDATGDADICRFSGESTSSFRENRFAAWYYQSGKDGVKLQPYATPLYESLPEEDRHYDGNLTDDVSAMIIDGHRGILARILKMRAKDGDETLVPVSLPMVPSFRMTTRLKGAYELDESEEGRTFEDSVGMTGDWRKAGPVFNIPFRCLFGHVPNLIAAGRCISVSTGMWDITRVIPVCAVTGEAAGTAAALLVRERCGAYHDIGVGRLQELLRANGVRINGTA